MQIVSLSLSHDAALASFLADFAGAGESWIPAYFPPHDAAISDAVGDLAAWSRGERIKEGWVPCSTWFVEDEGALLGVVNLRHVLTPALREHGGHIGYSVRPSARGKGVGGRCLAAGLDGARALGIEQALLTCEPENIGSWRVIERAGGVLQDERFHEPSQHLVRYYLVDTGTTSGS
jgi:predicted acetyltransferase